MQASVSAQGDSNSSNLSQALSTHINQREEQNEEKDSTPLVKVICAFCFVFKSDNHRMARPSFPFSNPVLGERRFNCSLQRCFISFQQQANADRVRFVCPQCEQFFRTKQSLNKHMNEHDIHCKVGSRIQTFCTFGDFFKRS